MPKLKNTDAIKQMISGTHRTQTKTVTGYEKEIVNRKEGDIWTDDNNHTWIKTSYGRASYNPSMANIRKYLNTARNCPEIKKNENYICKFGKKSLDKKYNNIHGMCMDCSIAYEQKLRMEGKWEEYQKSKIKENALSWLLEAEQEVEEMIKSLRETPEFVNENGTIDKFVPNWDADKLEENIRTEWSRVQQETLIGIGETIETLNNIRKSKKEVKT